MACHGGLAGSIPLTIATDDHFSEVSIGIISTEHTIFSGFAMAVTWSDAWTNLTFLGITSPCYRRLKAKYIMGFVLCSCL